MALDGRSYSTIKVGNGTTVKIEYRDSLPSTSALAKECAEGGYPDRYAIFTEKQSSGQITGSKIREGKYEHGVFISLILRPSFFPAQAGAIGPISIAALTQAIESFTSNRIGISWPTDLYCEGVKIGGTQIEGKLNSFTAYEYIIVSFAVRIDEKYFPPRLKDMVKQVFEKDNNSLGMMMARAILDRFFNAYLNIRTPEKHLQYYSKKFMLKDVKAKYIQDGKKRSCRIVGINSETHALTVQVSKNRLLDINKPSDVIIPRKIKLPQKNQNNKA